MTHKKDGKKQGDERSKLELDNSHHKNVKLID